MDDREKEKEGEWVTANVGWDHYLIPSKQITFKKTYITNQLLKRLEVFVLWIKENPYMMIDATS